MKLLKILLHWNELIYVYTTFSNSAEYSNLFSWGATDKSRWSSPQRWWSGQGF